MADPYRRKCENRPEGGKSVDKEIAPSGTENAGSAERRDLARECGEVEAEQECCELDLREELHNTLSEYEHYLELRQLAEDRYGREDGLMLSRACKVRNGNHKKPTARVCSLCTTISVDGGRVKNPYGASVKMRSTNAEILQGVSENRREEICEIE